MFASGLVLVCRLCTHLYSNPVYVVCKRFFVLTLPSICHELFSSSPLVYEENCNPLFLFFFFVIFSSPSFIGKVLE